MIRAAQIAIPRLLRNPLVAALAALALIRLAELVLQNAERSR